MLAAQMVAPGRLELGEFPVPVPDEDQVLVRMVAGSVCGSDLHVVFGPFHPEEFPALPGHPGHEGVGVVEASRSSLFRVGDRVLTVPYIGRMTCFAEYHLAECRSLVKLAPDADLASVLMAQQLGTVVFAMKRFCPGPGGESATVVGAGSAGLFFLQLLKLRGFRTVVVSDPVPARRDIALELGADHVVDPTTTSVDEVSRDVTGGRGPDVVIEAAGTELARQQAVACAKQDGRVGFFGYAEHPTMESFPYAQAWRKALDMVASVNTQLEPGTLSFKEAVRLISTGEVPVKHLIAAEPLPLSRVQDGFDAAREYRTPKVIFSIAESA